MKGSLLLVDVDSAGFGIVRPNFDENRPQSAGGTQEPQLDEGSSDVSAELALLIRFEGDHGAAHMITPSGP